VGISPGPGSDLVGKDFFVFINLTISFTKEKKQHEKLD
jgi:hypothetical protein